MTLPLDTSIHFSGSGLSYSAAGLPAGLSIDPATGVIAGVPTSVGSSAATVTARNAAGSATGAFTWTIVAAAAQEPPVNTRPPTISGVAEVGATLTADPGEWTGAPPPQFSYQWRRDGVEIGGATAPEYVASPADDAAGISVTVAGANAAGAASASSAPRTVTYPAPGAAGGLPDLDLTVGSGPRMVDAAQDFENAVGGVWSVTGGDAAISATGVVTIPADAARDQVEIVVSYENSGGAASSGFFVTVKAAAAAIPVTSRSLRFPASNPKAAAADMAFLRVRNFTSSANPLWRTDSAWLALVEIPAESLSATSTGDTHKLRSVVFGNGKGRTTNGGTMALSVTPPTNSFAVDGSEHGTLHFFWRGGAGISEASLPIGDHRRILFAMRLNGASARIEAYANGALVAGADVLAPTPDRLRSDFAIGCDLDFSSGGAASVSAAGGFDGALQMLGFVEGPVSAADCEAISVGVDPLSLHAEANWRLYRRPVDTGAGSLAAAASGDAGAPMTVFGSGFRPGSDIAPVRAATGWLALDAAPAGRVWGAAPGAATGAIRLSGAASGLTGGVEARYYDQDGTIRQDWTALVGADLAAGAWTGTMSAPLGAGWGYVDVRSAADPSLVHAMRIDCGVGYQVAALGQSQVTHALTIADLGLAPSAPRAFSIARHQRASGTPRTGVISLTPVSAARPVADGVAALADLFAAYTDAPICLLAFEHAGTGMGALTDDSDPDRAWADLDALAALAGAKDDGGAGLAAVAMNWSNNNSSPNTIIEDFFAPMLTGSAPVNEAHAIDHHFRDGTFPASMAFAVSPVTRYTTTGDAGPNDASGTTYTRNAALARAGLLAYAAAEGLPVGPFVDDMVIEPAGGPHADPATIYGPVRLARRMGVALARALGLDAGVDPAIAGVTRSGARLTATVTRPGGGELQTAWALAGVTPPAGWPEVQGFEVSIDGGTTWSNGRDGAPVTFDAAIADAAAGVVHIDRTGGGTWPANTAWRYAANGPVDYGTGVESLRLVHGLLYEAGPLEGGIGLPVKGLAEGVAA